MSEFLLFFFQIYALVLRENKVYKMYQELNENHFTGLDTDKDGVISRVENENAAKAMDTNSEC